MIGSIVLTFFFWFIIIIYNEDYINHQIIIEYNEYYKKFMHHSSDN